MWVIFREEWFVSRDIIKEHVAWDIKARKSFHHFPFFPLYITWCLKKVVCSWKDINFDQVILNNVTLVEHIFYYSVQIYFSWFICFLEGCLDFQDSSRRAMASKQLNKILPAANLCGDKGPLWWPSLIFRILKNTHSQKNWLFSAHESISFIYNQ